MAIFTETHRANLNKLADYLDALPADYERFDMVGYSHDRQRPNEIVNECGSAACAVGYAPLAGIEPQEDEGWGGYEERVFGTRACTLVWLRLFGPDNPNCPRLAAARIREELARDA